jgi:hypothetical protein
LGILNVKKIAMVTLPCVFRKAHDKVTKLLANQAVGKAVVLLCQPVFANSRRFPVAEGNGSRADGVPPSPTVHMAVGEAFPTGPAFLLAKSSFPSLKTPTVLSQQELGNPVGKAFANRVGVFANSLAKCCCRSARFL